MKYESASEQGPYLLQLWYTRGCENSMAETESRSMIVRMVTNHPVIIVLQLRGSRLCESNLRIGPYHLVDNVLGPAGNVA